MAAQPAEGTTGLSSAELAALSVDSLNDRTQPCIRADSYVARVHTVTAGALSGATSAKLGLAEVTGMPAIVVDGREYAGALDDAAQFEAFLAGT